MVTTSTTTTRAPPSTTTTRARGKLTMASGWMWLHEVNQMTKEKFIDQFTQERDPVTCQEYLKMVGGIENLLNLYQKICVEDGDWMNVLFDPERPTQISRTTGSHTWSVCWVDDEL